ncbi:MAG: hypothetical protein ACE37M_07865 [Henriciella sp.]
MLRATAFALTLLSAFSASAHATGLKATQIVEVATIIVDVDGNETTSYSQATEVEPGERVRYSLAYANEGADEAENVSLVMPVPTVVTYVEGSAHGSVEFSADNGRSYAAREDLMIGTGEYARLAVSEEITHIKWAFSDPIAPSANGTVSFEAVLK